MKADRLHIFVVTLLATGTVSLGQVAPGQQEPATSGRGFVSRPRVGDVTRLQGQGTNVLVGQGLVTGLDGSGDGSKFLSTINKLTAMKLYHLALILIGRYSFRQAGHSGI